MEVISIDGIEYVRAAQLAKRFKYTSDYIGQLCRGGKVDAKLVGRTWYVNPESLEGHRTTRHIKTSSDEKTSTSNVRITVSRQDVEPVMRKETAKSISQAGRTSSNFLRRIEWKPLRYETDSADLLPPLGQPAEPTRVNVTLAEATKVRISGGNVETKLVTEALPEVTLAGSLKIASLDDNFDKDLENIAISDEGFLDSEPEPDSTPVPRTPNESPKRPGPKMQPVKTPLDLENPTYEVAIRQERFTPARISQSEALAEASATHSVLPWVILFLLTVGATLAVVFLEVAVSATSVDQSFSVMISEVIFR